MNSTASTGIGSGTPDLTGKVIRRFIQVGVGWLVSAAVLFLSAGSLSWPMAWVYLVICAAIVAINGLVILPRKPELIAERGQFKEGIKGWDRWLGVLVGLVGPLSILALSGLDVRFTWSPALTGWIPAAALVAVALGYGLVSWAMASNEFFAGFVRIQTERGHTVASAGPYRFVRHPGYVGMMAYSLATPLMLGSLWALVPAALVAMLFVLRTALEDRTLQGELSGYREYARQVRFRLVPGLW